MNSNDLLQWYLSNRNMGSLVPDTGRAVGFPTNTAVQSGGTALVPYSGNPVANPSTALTRSYPQWWEGQWSAVPNELEGGARAALSGPKGGLISRAASALSTIMPRAAGTLAGATGWPMLMLAAGDGRPDNTEGDLAGLTQAYKDARASNANAQVAKRFGAMAPASAYPTPAQGPAVPGGVVAGSPLPDIPTPNQQVANRFPAMDPAVLAKGDMLQPNSNQYVTQNFPPTMVQGGGAQPHVPMPRPRPQFAPSDPNRGNMPVPTAPSPMSFFQRNAAMMRDPVTGMFIDPANAARAQASFPAPGAVGPTSVGGAPLQSAPRPNGGLLSQMIWRLTGNS